MTLLYSLGDAILRSIAAAAPYGPFFATLTAITAGLIAAGAFWLRRSALPREQWLQYFSFGFAVFSLQYAIPSMYGIYWLLFPQPHAAPSSLLPWIAAIASSAGNIFFLAAARSLLRRNAFPWWSWALAVTAASIDLSLSEISPWHRIPYALFSAVSFGTLGYALFANISPRRRRNLAQFVLLGGILYVGLNLLYALNPPLTEGGLWPSLASAVAEHLGRREITPRQAIDTYLVAWALPLKILLAGGGFALVFRTLVTFSPKTLERSLQYVNLRRTDFFAEEAFSSIFGEHFQADKAILCFRLPGLLDKRVAWWEWHRSPPPAWRARSAPVPRTEGSLLRSRLLARFRQSARIEQGWIHKKVRVTPLPWPMDSPEGSVLSSGMPYERLRISGKDPFAEISWHQDPTYPSKIVVPVIFRGTIVGCLSAEWETEYAFTLSAVDQLRTLADFFAPSIDQRRRLASIHYWVEELQRFDLQFRGGYRGIATEVASLIHRTLSPLSVSLSLHVGFRPVWAAAGDAGFASGDLGGKPSREVSETLYALSGFSASQVTVKRSLLEIRNFPIGTLSLAWPDADLSGFRTRPTVFPDFVLLRSIAALISVSILNASHVELSGVLNNLQIALSDKAVRTRERWFSALDAAVVESGLLWLVAVHPSGDMQGQETYVEMIRTQKVAMIPSGESHIPIHLLSLSTPVQGTCKLLHLLLPTTGGELWLGVANRRFGREIAPATSDWPWRIFLNRLAETADSALSRIMSREEVERLQDQADQFRSLFASSADASTFFHECRNIARNFTFTAQSLQETWDLQLVTAPPTIAADIARSISGLLTSAKRLFGLTDALMQVRRIEDQIACNLLKAALEVQEILQHILSDKKITFDISGINKGIFVNSPFWVTYQTILSLVSNSIDAIRSGGGSFIRLESEDLDSGVLCRVIDDGPGIPDDLKEKIFGLGVSTKAGTGGKGLFIVQTLLRQSGADIRLETSSPGCTVFAINFPKASAKGRIYESEESPAR
jgi:signal transduction histidine kinase